MPFHDKPGVADWLDLPRADMSRPVARVMPVEPPPVEGRMFGAARGLYAPPPADAFAPLDEADLADGEGE